uniref:RNA-directed DNA polymerase n=1 Tax=Trichuris muris TaxID=70415 RepID=A0A5S6QDJ8_TRIMR
MLAGLQGTVAYLDDVIVVGKTMDDHQKILDAVLNRIDEFEFTIRPEKWCFAMDRIQYLGFVFDKSGRCPDPSKIEPITSIPAPKDVTNLRSFLGMLSYYGSFVKEMREIRAPLDAFLKMDRPFIWFHDCQKAFDKAKAVLNSELLLTHYDPSLEIIVAAYASDKGLEAVIMHRFPGGFEKAIAHASRSPTVAEKGYSPIEKEALSLIFAVKKLHRMIHAVRKEFRCTAPIACSNGPLYYWHTIFPFSIAPLLVSAVLMPYQDQFRTTCEEAVIASVDADVQRVVTDAIRALPVIAKQIKEETAKDQLLNEVFHFPQSEWPQDKQDK